MTRVLVAILTAVLSYTVKADTIPIISISVPVTEMSETEAFKLYTGEYKKWPNGTRVTIFIQDPDSISVKAFSIKLGITPSRFSSRINTNLSDGAVINIVDTPSQVILGVLSTPNSAGLYSGFYIVRNMTSITELVLTK